MTLAEACARQRHAAVRRRRFGDAPRAARQARVQDGKGRHEPEVDALGVVREAGLVVLTREHALPEGPGAAVPTEPTRASVEVAVGRRGGRWRTL